MGVQPLSVVPKAFVCSKCGKSSESPAGWLYRKESQGRGKSVEINYCPDCGRKAQQEIEDQSSDADLAGAAMLGAGAAVVGAAAWFGIVLGTDTKFGIAAIGLGILVGRAVYLGSGKKRSSSLQFVSAAFTALGLLGGEYLITNHLVRKYVEGFTGWLGVREFVSVYLKLLTEGNWLYEVFFLVVAMLAAIGQLRPLKLRDRKA